MGFTLGVGERPTREGGGKRTSFWGDWLKRYSRLVHQDLSSTTMRSLLRLRCTADAESGRNSPNRVFEGFLALLEARVASQVGVDHHRFWFLQDGLPREGLELQDALPYSAEHLRDELGLCGGQLLQVLLSRETRGSSSKTHTKV